MSLMGVDLGTSGCRAVAYSEDLTELAAATEDYPRYPTVPGVVELDVDEVVAVVLRCIAAVNRQLDADSVDALSVAGMGETIVAVDRGGRPLAPVRMSSDRRGEAEMAAITAAIGEQTLRSRTGQPAHPMFSIAHLAWARRKAPYWPDVALILDINGYVLRYLGGEPVFDYSMASRTAAFDVARRRWDDELLAAADCPPSLLPTAVPVGTPIGRVAPDIARRLGFTHPPVLVAGGHDQACGFWGAGVQQSGQPVLSVGTTECLTTAHSGPPGELIARNYASYPVDDDDEWLSLAGIPAGGAAMLWLAGVAHEPLSQLLDQLPPDPATPLCLAHFHGSGTLENDPLSTGAFLGLTLSTTAADLLLAVLEASGFEVARNLAVLGQFHDLEPTVRIVGGGIRHRRAITARADAAGVVMAPVPGHSTARGAAILAGCGVGLWDRASTATKIVVEPLVAPNPRHREWFAERRNRHARLHPLLAAPSRSHATAAAAADSAS